MQLTFFFYIFNTDFFLKYINFWLHWVFVLHAGFLQLQQAGATLWLWCTGFSRQRLLFAEPGLQVHRLSSCAWAQMLCGTYDLPGPGIESESLALVGRFSTTEPSGKFSFLLLMVKIHYQNIVFINIYYQNSILLINEFDYINYKCQPVNGLTLVSFLTCESSVIYSGFR